MRVPIEVLAQQVMALPTTERAQLLDQVIRSLEADRERDARWDEVAAQREVQARTDPTAWISGPEAVTRIRARIE